MCIIIISRSSLKLGHVGSKTRSLGQQATQVSDLGPLWPSSSVDLFETLHTCCGHIEDVHVVFLMELELLLTDLQPIELSHYRQLFAL